MQQPTNELEIGYIYCLSNESYKDTYKIGFTKNDPLTRMAQLNTTGLLYPFKLEFAKQVKNYQDKEKKLHLIFDKYRVNKNREFFKIELKEIKQLFDLIDGEWYKLNSPNKEPTKPICKASNINPSSEKTSLTGFKHSTDGNTNVKTLVKNVEHTFCIQLKEPTKPMCKASNISPSSEKTSLTGFKHSIYSSADGNTNVKTLVKNVEHTFCIPLKNTHCSRCYDKLNIQQGLIKCKHLDMCNECCNVIKNCPICKVPYNT